MWASWTINKAEHWRIDAFELWCWKRLLRVPWTARRSNQSILKEISPEYTWKDWCWSWNSNTLAPHVKNWLIWKDPDAGKYWRQEEKGMRWLDGITQLNGHEFEQALGVGDGQGSLACCCQWGCKELDMTEWLNWKTEIEYSTGNSSQSILCNDLYGKWILKSLDIYI